MSDITVMLLFWQ